MNKLKINFENCYGIKKLDYEFDLSIGDDKKGIYSIYAPNGFMKTSFAKTFHDIQTQKDTKEERYNREAVRSVVLDNNNELKPENICVIKPYDKSYSSEKTSLLLVNKDLKQKYDAAVSSIEEKLADIFKHLKKYSGLTTKALTPETEIKEVFQLGNQSIYDFFDNILADTPEGLSFKDIAYKDVFNKDSLKLFESGAISQQLAEYIEKYDELIANSPILTHKFNHHSVNQISKSLADNSFFYEKHSVNIFDGENKTEITNKDQFEQLFTDEKNKILNDTELKEKFDQVDNKLTTVSQRKFRDYLHNHKELLPELVDYKALQKKIWFSYFYDIKELIANFSNVYKLTTALIGEVTETAKNEKTAWAEVVYLFNQRFDVPFTLKIENQTDVLLKNTAPKVAFEVNEFGEAPKIIEKNNLIETLSQGERRALYILDVLFEINARQHNEIETLFIIDDIADSFDYKNKYAIVEYFKDVATTAFFKIIFLTHNFDFHRTISSRIGIKRQHRLFVTKNDIELKLVLETYQKNPFVDAWKKKLHTNNAYLLASVPFVRNLAEYCSGTEDSDYKKLTSLLHLKPDTKAIKVSDLQQIYRGILKDKADLELQQPDKAIITLLYEVVDELIASNNETVELESKVILSIAIRLSAEKYMINKIKNEGFVEAITSDQTMVLFERFSADCPDETTALEVLDQVNLMTPENIHLNSFMYEPILDMSAIHLYQLYEKVKKLND